MRKIQILGTGCPKCKKLAENAQEAMQGVAMTPGLPAYPANVEDFAV